MMSGWHVKITSYKNVRTSERNSHASLNVRSTWRGVANLCGNSVIRITRSYLSQSATRKQAKLCHRDH